jgi:hypothetical protein
MTKDVQSPSYNIKISIAIYNKFKPKGTMKESHGYNVKNYLQQRGVITCREI